MDVSLFVVVCCLLLAVAAMFSLCKIMQMVEGRKFNGASAEDFGEPGAFGAHGGGGAATAAGGYVLIPGQIHRHPNPNSKNGKSRGSDKEDKLPPGMDPRDPDAWKRSDSQNDSFADRKDDPWKCDAPKIPSAPAPTAGIVAAGAAAGSTGVAVAGVAAHHAGQSEAAIPDSSTTRNPADAAVATNEQLVNAGVDVVDAMDNDDEPVAGALGGGLSFPTTNNSTAAALEPKVTVVPFLQDAGPAIASAPAPAPTPSFSTVGFWEAQEAAHAAAKSGGDSYYSGYGNDTSGSSSGWGYGGGDSGGRSGGGDYGGGYYGSDVSGDSSGGTLGWEENS